MNNNPSNESGGVNLSSENMCDSGVDQTNSQISRHDISTGSGFFSPNNSCRDQDGLFGSSGSNEPCTTGSDRSNCVSVIVKNQSFFDV